MAIGGNKKRGNLTQEEISSGCNMITPDERITLKHDMGWKQSFWYLLTIDFTFKTATGFTWLWWGRSDTWMIGYYNVLVSVNSQGGPHGQPSGFWQLTDTPPIIIFSPKSCSDIYAPVNVKFCRPPRLVQGILMEKMHVCQNTHFAINFLSESHQRSIFLPCMSESPVSTHSGVRGWGAGGVAYQFSLPYNCQLQWTF